MDRPAAGHPPLCVAEDAAQQLEAAIRFVLSHQGIAKISLLSHSWGAMPACRFAGALPALVDRLVLFAPIARRVPQGDDARWLFGALTGSPLKRDIKIGRGTHLMHLEAMRLALWQTELVLQQLKLCVETAGSSLENVLKCNVYCTSVEKFAAVNAIYARYFPKNPPARIFINVPAWPGHFDIEIDCIAAVL
jgi:pimeloyl-ACP methyl ester carboxylesterase